MSPAGRPEIFVVTGASAGIGRAVVRELAKRRVLIGLLARGQDRLEAARREVEAAGGLALVIPTDVSDPNQVEAAAEAVERELGPIDIWINNAMVSVLSPAKEMSPAEFRRVTEVTYLGYVHGTLAALKRMLPRDRGVIVQVGSALSYRSIPLQSAYCAAKHAINGFTESLRSELIHDGSRVQVTMVQLPGVNTPQFGWIRSRMPRYPQPMPPFYQPEVIARGIVHAVFHPRREVWLGWPTVKAIIGDKVIPGLLDHYLAMRAYTGQQASDVPYDRARQDNLYGPPPGDPGAHGAFDHRAHAHSWQVWAALNQGWLTLLGAGMLAAVGVALYSRAEEPRPKRAGR
jgi:NAD(P)-dependent dehydrogenase (short-subunit alcohol dehydrogenase family)